MLKAIFFDLDETLCDTTGANQKAVFTMAKAAHEIYGAQFDSDVMARLYLKGIYRDLDDRYSKLLTPITDEKQFRLDLIKLILTDLGVTDCLMKDIEHLQMTFDNSRTDFFDFFYGIRELLIELRMRYSIVVITNGPEFSQVIKVETVKLKNFVDHVIIGGQEKEQKPAKSIFDKALSLAGCKNTEAIHIGDSLSADIQGAINAGINNVWISHGNELDDSSPIKPTHIIETPFQIKDLLEKIVTS